MTSQGISPMEQFDQARTAYDAARARVASLAKQVDAQRSAVALARANAEQVSVRRSQLQANEHQEAAANAQRAKADVRLAYTEIHAPIDGIVDVRAVRLGEVVNPGQPVVTLINPDDLWVRADVEETYIDRVRLGDKLTVRLPSGAEREGTRLPSGRRRRLRHPTRCQPHQAGHQDLRDSTARRQSRSRARRRHDGVRLAAGQMTRMIHDSSDTCERRADHTERGRTRLLGLANPACRQTRVLAMNAIDVQQIVKKFGDFTAVNGISFAVEAGEIFGLLGPNGAGKSTLIRMLTTLLPPTSGTATVGGFNIVTQADGVRHSIGVIPQAMTSDLELSVEENLLIYAKLYGVPRAKRTG